MLTTTVETFLTVLMMAEIFLIVETTMQIFLAALVAAMITLNEKSCSVQGGRGMSFTVYF